jgi:hypothetical protein
LRATVAVTSGSASPASGLLPIPEPQHAMSALPTARSSSIKRPAHQPCARPWVGARLRATAAVTSDSASPASGLLPIPEPQHAMSALPTARSSSIRRPAHQPCARLWVGARLRATAAVTSGSASPASGLLPIPEPQHAMSALPTARSSSIERPAHQPCARLWVGARLRATAAVTSGSASPASGLLPIPARPYAMSALPTAPSSSIRRPAHQPCARLWVGARLRATVAVASDSASPASGLLPIPEPQHAMSALPTARSSSIRRPAHQPCARLWVGARLRATVAVTSGSASPASGLLPIPEPQHAMSALPTARSSSIRRPAHQPCARPWVGARLRATVAVTSGSASPASGLLPIPEPQHAMSALPTARSSSIRRPAHQPCARLWVGARLRATVAVASGSASPASGLLPIPEPQRAMSALPTARSSSIRRPAHQPCARPWVGARLRATVAVASGSASPASGLLPIPARPYAMSALPTAPSSSIRRPAHQPCARPWVGARLRATAAVTSDSASPASGLLPIPARPYAMSALPTAPSSSIRRPAHQPCARPWVGARLRATVAVASDSASPASGLLPIPEPQRAMSALPTAPSSSIRRPAHQPCARPWVGARLRATAAVTSGSASPASGLLPIPEPQHAMSALPTAPSSSIRRPAHQPCARPWVGARLRATAAVTSGSASPASGLLPIPEPQHAMSALPTARNSSIERPAHQPCARPWVGARLRATVAVASGSASPASGLLPIPARPYAMSALPTAPSSSIRRPAHQPCARPWVGARLRATAAVTSDSASPASGLLPIPARPYAMSALPTAPSSSIRRPAHQPCARPWVGARLRATVAVASDSASPASGLLPIPEPQRAMSALPTAPSSSIRRPAHQPCARPWVGARLRATAAVTSGSASPASGLLPIPARPYAMSALPTARSSSIRRPAHQPCARLWVGARLRATAAVTSGSASPASGLLPIPARPYAMSALPTARNSSIERPAHQPCARPWVGARLRATVAIASNSPSPASGLLPIPERPYAMSFLGFMVFDGIAYPNPDQVALGYPRLIR